MTAQVIDFPAPAVAASLQTARAVVRMEDPDPTDYTAALLVLRMSPCADDRLMGEQLSRMMMES